MPFNTRKHFHSRNKEGKSRHTPTYTSWREMKRRCLDPGRPDFKWYGARGIQICPRWLGADGFVNFLTDMGEAPPGFTIDRVNFHGHYEPENCKWSSRAEQTANRRTPDRDYDPEDWKVPIKWPQLEIIVDPVNIGIDEEIPF